jgi:twitching motility protein PilT
MMNYNLPERRVAHRVYIKVPLSYEILDPADNALKTKTVMTGNISESGIYFETEEPPPLKVEIKASFKLPKSDNTIRVTLKVMRIETTGTEKLFGIGSTFVDLPAKDLEDIKRMTDRLNIGKLLELTIQKGASDLHLLADQLPVIRVQGDLETVDIGKLSSEDIPTLIYSFMNKQQIRRFEQTKELDFGLQYDMRNRFRVNLHMQRGFMEATFRLITTRIFSFEELNIPEAVKDLARLKEGLVLIAGPTGSGKSTTMAAMVELINEERKVVVITLERPIEYVFINKKSIIKQREIGVDTSSFSVALQSSLRQDPNVIVVGELEDTETVKTALIAAEAGYLVIASFHAPNTIHAIDRLVNVFPPENRKQVLSQVSNCLRGIVTQLLVPTTDRKTRVLATEILISNDAVKRVIRNDDLIQIPTIIQTGSAYKMLSMSESIRRYVEKGIVDREMALFFSQETETGMYNRESKQRTR